MFRLFALTLALVAGSTSAFAAQIVRFDLTPQMKTFLKQNEFDVAGVNYKTMEIEVIASEEDLQTLIANKANIKFSFPQELLAAPDEDYKNPQEIEDFLVATHAKYPDITELKSIGKTLEGRDIWAIKISDNVRTDEVEPVIFVNGMHHAREVMTTEITTDMVDYLTANYGVLPEVTKWVNTTEVWVLPMFNLDGNNKVWTEDSLWRKNTRGKYGVDLNRNYPTGWNSCDGSSGRESAQDYRGPSPASEPETQHMMNFVASIKPVFDISYHSYSEIVIYPYGCGKKKTPAEQAVEMIGAEIGKKINYKPGTAWELLYNADGGDIDWMYTEHQVIPFVIEVNSTGQGGFHPNYKKHRDVTVQRNRPGWMHLFTRLEGPSLQGVASKLDYSVIKVSLANDANVFQTYTINPDGSYYIMLKPGTYDFVFEGTKTKKISGMSIQSRQILSI